MQKMGEARLLYSILDGIALEKGYYLKLRGKHI